MKYLHRIIVVYALLQLPHASYAEETEETYVVRVPVTVVDQAKNLVTSVYILEGSPTEDVLTKAPNGVATIDIRVDKYFRNVDTRKKSITLAARKTRYNSTFMEHTWEFPSDLSKGFIIEIALQEMPRHHLSRRPATSLAPSYPLGSPRPPVVTTYQPYSTTIVSRQILPEPVIQYSVGSLSSFYSPQATVYQPVLPTVVHPYPVYNIGPAVQVGPPIIVLESGTIYLPLQ